MKVWLEELSFEYSRYLFGYHLHALPHGESFEAMYRGGFLPAAYPQAQPRQFYMARSIRVPLAGFHFSSENKRVEQKFAFHREVTAAANFNFDAADFRGIALPYLNEVIGIDGAGKLRSVLRAQMTTDVVTYRQNGNGADGAVQGYVFLVRDGAMVHYWFSFFSLALVKKSFGVWMMLQELKAAQKENYAHLYLGTCYGAKGRYKLNFAPFEFWDGNGWTGDKEKLKSLLKTDLQDTAPTSA